MGKCKLLLDQRLLYFPWGETIMAERNEEVIGYLNDLVATCKDGEQGKCAQHSLESGYSAAKDALSQERLFDSESGR